LNFFKIQNALFPVSKMNAAFYASAKSAKRILSVHAGRCLASVPPSDYASPVSDYENLHLLLSDFSCHCKGTGPVYLASDGNGALFLASARPWRGRALAPLDFALENSRFVFRDGGYFAANAADPETGYALLTKRDLLWSDFSVTIRDASIAGVVFGFKNPRNFIQIAACPDGVSAWSMKNGVQKRLFGDTLLPRKMNPCKIEVRRAGGSLYFFVNDFLIRPVKEPVSENGRIGIFTVGGDAARPKFYRFVVNDAHVGKDRWKKFFNPCLT
jgi:hypothetical protein